MERININGIDYDISFIDDMSTVKNMIALKLHKPPANIRFTTFNPTAKKIKIQVLDDVLAQISPEKLKEQVELLETEWGQSNTYIALVWLSNRIKRELTTLDMQIVALLKSINSTDFWNMNAINSLYRNYVETAENIQSELRKQVSKESDYRKEYAKYSPVPVSDFLQDAVIIEYELEVDADPLELFDRLTLSERIPFVTVKTPEQQYYKLSKNLIPAKIWLQELEEPGLLFKVRSDRPLEDWISITFKYTPSETVIATFETSEQLSEQDIKTELFAVLGGEINLKKRQEKGIKGIFAVPYIAIAKPVFLELITNDNTVGYFLYVDESRELSTAKKTTYLYYSTNENADDIITVFLSEQIVTRSDPFYVNRQLSIHTPYINVRVSRAMNLEGVNRFKTAFATILDIYKKNFDRIEKEYSQVCKNFIAAKPDIEKEEGTRLRELQEQDSNLFIYQYPKVCQAKRQPKPITKQQQPEWTAKNRQVMRYPKDSNNYFVCDNDKYEFPGLVKNNLANNDLYKYLPCCYPIDQNVQGKTLFDYLNKLERAKTVSITKTATHIVEKKAIGPGKLGFLPRNIYHILGPEYLRVGTPFSPNSFIEAVLLAIDPNYTKQENKAVYVQDIRNNLASVDLIDQQLFNLDPQQTIQTLKDPGVPFDSSLYSGLLEAFLQTQNYNCQIVVFTRTREQPNGTFEIPDHAQGYLYRQLENKPTVIIYKHLGSKGDNLTYPHYELIVKKLDKEITTVFQDLQLVRKLYSYYIQSYRLFTPNLGEYARYNPVKLDNLPIRGQLLDKYGKTRALLFENNVSLWVSPIAPLVNVPILDSIPAETSLFSDVDKFLKQYNFSILEQQVKQDATVGLLVKVPGIPYAYIGVKPVKPLDKVKRSEGGLNLFYNDEESSREDVLESTKYNKKVADFLTQLVVYIFSKWYQREKPTLSDNTASIAMQNIEERKNIYMISKQFVKDNVVVLKNHDYKLKSLSRKISMNSSFFSDNKLIVDSQRTLEKIEYYLLHMLLKNRTSVLESVEKIYLDRYYTYAEDFTPHSDELIFVGATSINNWIENQKITTVTHTHMLPHPEEREPQFFSHWALNGNFPVIIQNVKGATLRRAISVALNWIDEHYNSGYSTPAFEEEDIPEYTKYYFKNGYLVKSGTSDITLWEYEKDKFAALLGDLRL